MRERLEQALSELPLNKADVHSVVNRLFFNPLLRGDTPQIRGSGFFDFRGKITAVVGHFAADGLGLTDYLRAAVKHPSLFYSSPATVQLNVDTVVDHFRDHGLTLRDYLRAAVKQPPLFYLSPTTIQSHVEGVVEHFREDGLTLQDYLRAAINQPSLFTLSARTVVAHIEAVIDHFRSHGLTRKDYLRAALKRPPLFAMSPATIQANVERVVDQFYNDGLAPGDYLRAAVKNPSLFYQSPATIIGHINMAADLYRRGLLHLRDADAGHPPDSIQPVLKFLVTNPAFLTLADENFMLREVTARVGSNIFSGKDLLRKPRHAVESDLAARLGHGDLRLPVPKEPDGDGNHDRHTRNLLLRSLIRANLVKGTLDR